MSLFDFDDYKAYVMDRIRSMPNKGRGEFKRMAEHMRVHSTLISHIFRGDVELSSEQAAELISYFGLNELEADYFFALVQRARSGSISLNRILDRRIAQLRVQSSEIIHRVQPARVLDEKDKALFYSEWFFSGVRLLSAIPGFQDLDHIADRLGLNKLEVRRVVDFLVEVGLCKVDGGLHPTVKSTHVAADSPLAGRHHKNWRLKAMESISRLRESEMAFTMPVTLSAKDVLKVKKSLLQFIQQTDKLFDDSPPEKLYCLNIDWFEVSRER